MQNLKSLCYFEIIFRHQQKLLYCTPLPAHFVFSLQEYLRFAISSGVATGGGDYYFVEPNCRLKNKWKNLFSVKIVGAEEKINCAFC